jgi:hypothetical protein
MNATLDPREVDKPFVRRWLRAALALLIRSPFRFGILIAVLGCLDTSAVNLANGYVIERGNVQFAIVACLCSPIETLSAHKVDRGANAFTIVNHATGMAARELARFPMQFWTYAVAIRCHAPIGMQ